MLGSRSVSNLRDLCPDLPKKINRNKGDTAGTPLASIRSSKRLTLEPISAALVAAAGRSARPATKFELKVDGEWNATSSGGNMSHAEWRANPQYSLHFTPKRNTLSSVPSSPSSQSSLSMEMKMPSTPPPIISTFSLPTSPAATPPSTAPSPSLLSSSANGSNDIMSTPPAARRRNARVSITLTQQRAVDGSLLRIGFYVAKRIPGGLPGLQEKRLVHYNRDNFVSVSQFSVSESVSCEIALPATPLPYVIIPMTVNPGDCARFTISVTSSLRATLTGLDSVNHQWHTSIVSSEWRGRTAGGCRHYSTWRNNPQFALKLTQPTLVVVSLSQRPLPPLPLSSSSSSSVPLSSDAKKTVASSSSSSAAAANSEWDHTHMGLYVALKTTPANSRKLTLQSKDIVHKTLFLNQEEIVLEMLLVPSGFGYRLIPATYSAGELAQFTLRIWTDHPVTFSEVTETFHEQYYDGTWRPDDIDPEDIAPLSSSSQPSADQHHMSGRVKKKKKKMQRIEAAGAVGEWTGEDREASLSLLRATRNQQIVLRCTHTSEATTCVVALLQVIKDAHLDLLCIGFHLLKVTPTNGTSYVGFTSATSTPSSSSSSSSSNGVTSSFLSSLAATPSNDTLLDSPPSVPRLRSRKRVSFVDQPLIVKDNVPASHHLTVDEHEVSQVFRTEFSVTWEVSKKFILPPLSKEEPGAFYVLVPSVLPSSPVGLYQLAFYSDHALQLLSLPSPMHIRPGVPSVSSSSVDNADRPDRSLLIRSDSDALTVSTSDSNISSRSPLTINIQQQQQPGSGSGGSGGTLVQYDSKNHNGTLDQFVSRAGSATVYTPNIANLIDASSSPSSSSHIVAGALGRPHTSATNSNSNVTTNIGGIGSAPITPAPGSVTVAFASLAPPASSPTSRGRSLSSAASVAATTAAAAAAMDDDHTAARRSRRTPIATSDDHDDDHDEGQSNGRSQSTTGISVSRVIGAALVVGTATYALWQWRRRLRL